MNNNLSVGKTKIVYLSYTGTGTSRTQYVSFSDYTSNLLGLLVNGSEFLSDSTEWQTDGGYSFTVTQGNFNKVTACVTNSGLWKAEKDSIRYDDSSGELRVKGQFNLNGYTYCMTGLFS